MIEIQKALIGKELTKQDIIKLLAIKDKKDQELLMTAARELRFNNFEDAIYLYGFVYFSTYCQNNCNFCYFRKENAIQRYRKSPKEVLGLAKSLVESGVHLIDLTMGEDPEYQKDNFSEIVELSKNIKDATDIPMMLSPGVMTEQNLDDIAAVGMDWFALYQETHNKELFKTLRVCQDYDRRMTSKIQAKKRGLLIEEGILVGVGESYEDIADSIIEMKRIGAKQVRVMSFVPQEGSPMENNPQSDYNLELKTIAILRLVFPEALIPASLDIEGLRGLSDRLDAGANVITSIIPPETGLAGVAQSYMDVDGGGRTVEQVRNVLKVKDLSIGSIDEYKKLLEKYKGKSGK